MNQKFLVILWILIFFGVGLFIGWKGIKKPSGSKVEPPCPTTTSLPEDQEEISSDIQCPVSEEILECSEITPCPDAPTFTPCPEITSTPCPIPIPNCPSNIDPIVNLIYSKNTNQCLDVTKWGTGNTGSKGLSTCQTENHNQKFEFKNSPLSTSTQRIFQIKSVSSGKCLDNGSGGNWTWQNCKDMNDPSQLFNYTWNFPSSGSNWNVGIQNYSSDSGTPVECLDFGNGSQKASCSVGSNLNQNLNVWNHTN